MKRLFIVMVLVCHSALATVMLTITRRDMNTVNVEYGTVNILTIGDKVIVLDYTTDRIFKNGFE